MTDAVNVVAEWQSMTDATSVSQPNKRDIKPESSAIDEMKKMREQAAEAVSPVLNNLKEQAQFYVFKSIPVDASSVRGGLKTHENPDLSDSETSPASSANTEIRQSVVMAHYGFVSNGTNIMVDRNAPHINFHVAYEVVTETLSPGQELDPSSLTRAGHKCKVRVHTDDATIMQVVSWAGDPRTDNSDIIAEQWYQGGAYDPANTRPGNSAGDRGRSRPSRGGRSGGRGGRGPEVPGQPGEQLPQNPAEARAQYQRYGIPPVSEVTDDPNTWLPNPPLERRPWRMGPGRGLLSTYDPTTDLGPDILPLYETYPLGHWGPTFKKNKPPGLPLSAHPVLSQRSSIRILDTYLNQLPDTVIPVEHLWWTKAIVTGLFKGESAFLLGNPASNLDCRGKADDLYYIDSYEKGTKRRNVIQHFITDGPRHPSHSFISAVGFHGANYLAWNMWCKTANRPEGHICLQSYKDESQIPYIYYYMEYIKVWYDAEENKGKEITPEIAVKLLMGMKIHHASQGLGRLFKRRTKGLTDLSGVYLRKRGAKYEEGPVIKKFFDEYKSKFSRQRLNKSMFGRMQTLEEILRDSTIGGDIMIRLYSGHNYSDSNPALEKEVDGRRYGFMSPKTMSTT
jgi:hypothetical protein